MTIATTVASKLPILYYSSLCPFAQRSVIALAETKQKYEKVSIDLSKPREPWYLETINPAGKVPAMKVAGENSPILVESLVLAEYIAEIHPEAGLISDDAVLRAQSRLLVAQYDGKITPLYFQLLKAESEAVEEVSGKLIAELELFSTALGNAALPEGAKKGPFFLGEKFTYADLAIAPFVSRFFALELKSFKLPTAEQNPKLARYLEYQDALINRESVKNSINKEDVLAMVKRVFLKQ